MLKPNALSGFGARKRIQYGNFDGVSIHYKSNHTDPVRATISWSTNNSSFTDVGTVGDWASSADATKTGSWTAPGRKRYWRINFTDPNDGNISATDFLYEITFTENGTPVTAKSDAVVTTGSLSSGSFTNPTNSYDNNDATYAQQSGQSCYILIDFGA